MPVVVPPRGTRGVKFPIPGGRIGAFMTSIMAFLGRHGVRIQGRPLLQLITLGAKSGLERRTVLGWFDDPSNPKARLIVGSFAGAAVHPAWFLNLAKHPDAVQMEDAAGRVAVSVATVEGAERDAAWAGIAAVAPGYGSYETKTDREIPIIRLIPKA